MSRLTSATRLSKERLPRRGSASGLPLRSCQPRAPLQRATTRGSGPAEPASGLGSGSLQRSARTAGRSQEAAERVYRFIKRKVLVDLDSISPLPEGDASDGDPQVDRVGRMFLGVGRYSRPVELTRVSSTRGPRFATTSRQTLVAIR